MSRKKLLSPPLVGSQGVVTYRVRHRRHKVKSRLDVATKYLVVADSVRAIAERHGVETNSFTQEQLREAVDGGHIFPTVDRTQSAVGIFRLAESILDALDHHFLVGSPDQVRSQPPSPWGIVFVLTAYGLLITEAIGACVGVHFLWIAKSVEV